MGRRAPRLHVHGEAALDDRQQTPRKHVFVVNSSPDFLLIVRELLEAEGYAVTTSDFEPNVFTQIVMRQPNALMIDVSSRCLARLMRRRQGSASRAGATVAQLSPQKPD